MDHMEPFRVVFTMHGPIALRSDDQQHGCAILAWAFQRELGGDYKRAHQELPVASADGAFQVSALFKEIDQRDEVHAEPIIIRQSFSRNLSLFPNGVPKDKKGDIRDYPIRAESGLFRNIETRYTLLNAVRVHMFGVGRVADVDRLVRMIGYIGAHGYGVIHNTIEDGPAIEVGPVDADPATFGFVDARGAPARALPLPLAEKLGVDIDRFPVVSSRISPPFWLGERVPCVVPPTAIVTHDEIAKMVEDGA